MTRRCAAPLALLLSAVVLLAGCGGSSTTASPATQPSVSATSGQDGASTPAPDASSPAPDASSSSPSTTGAVACPTANTKAFDKTRFVLHAGLAFGAFHRYLYKPFRAGAFAKGASGRRVALVKAGVSALFIKRELRLASEDARANPTLCKAIGGPLSQLTSTISNSVRGLSSGDPSGILAADRTITSLEQSAKNSGTGIVENPNPDLNG